MSLVARNMAAGVAASSGAVAPDRIQVREGRRIRSSAEDYKLTSTSIVAARNSVPGHHS